MSAVRMAPDDSCDAADLFAQIWANLVDLLGSAAAATVLRRSVKRASVTHPQLQQLTISREKLEYGYSLPAGWKSGSSESSAELQALVHQLQPILRELTGRVVLRRLSAVPDLAACNLFRHEDQT